MASARLESSSLPAPQRGQRYVQEEQTTSFTINLTAGGTTPEDAANRWRRNIEQKIIQPYTTAIKRGQQNPTQRRP